MVTPRFQTLDTEKFEDGQVPAYNAESGNFDAADPGTDDSGGSIDTDSILTMNGEILVSADGNVLTSA